MNTTLESRKINLVQHFLKLDNKETISKVENLLKQEQNRISKENLLKPYNEKKIIECLSQAEDDFEKGNFYSSDEMKKIIDSWE